MQVTSMKSDVDQAQQGPRGSPMPGARGGGNQPCGEKAPSPLLRCVGHGRRQPIMRANEEPFMATSRHGRTTGYVGGWQKGSLISLHVQGRIGTMEFAGDVKQRVHRVVVICAAKDAMAERGHSSPDYRCVRRLLGRTHGGRRGSRTGAEGEDPGELWFR